MNEHFLKVIKQVGGQRQLGELMGVSQRTISHWLHYKIPAERVLQLVELSNDTIASSDLRPDLYA